MDNVTDKLLKYINSFNIDEKLVLMEACGTHTMSILKNGIKSLLPDNIRLVSGPGCPVCVTPKEYIDCAIKILHIPGTIIATFGDMIKLTGTESSLEREKSKGMDVRVVYSPNDALTLAKKNPDKKIIFLSIGFETTAAPIAVTVARAKEENVKNIFFLCGNKTMPEVLLELCTDEQIKIDGILYPGHVSTIIGTEIYEYIYEKSGVPGVVTGFELNDILYSVASILTMIYKKEYKVDINGYKRAVRNNGNREAVKKIYQVFKKGDSVWRGLGIIKNSGLYLNDRYSEFDANKHFNIHIEQNSTTEKGCICGEILKGLKEPCECPMFGTKCTPEDAYGACMVSHEGTCNVFYRYN